MAFVKLEKKGNRGHDQKWHEGGVKDDTGSIITHNCPCRGKEQKPSKRLVARQEHFDANKLGDIPGFHRPGSQNRKK